MRHLKSGSKLGRNPWHRRATLRNLVTNLLEHGRITTTLTRAKAARPVAEKMITLGKKDTLTSRRLAAAYIMTPGITQKLERSDCYVYGKAEGDKITFEARAASGRVLDKFELSPRKAVKK